VSYIDKFYFIFHCLTTHSFGLDVLEPDSDDYEDVNCKFVLFIWIKFFAFKRSKPQ